MQGRILRVSGLQCLVEVEQSYWQCQIRGRLKAGRRTTSSPVVAGDWVEIVPTAARTGVIEAVHPRSSKFSRGTRGTRPFEQILFVNMEQLVVVVAACQPRPRRGFMDRALVMAIKGNLQPVFCINKIDLVSQEAVDTLAAPYEALGYPIYRTSAVAGDGMGRFKEALIHRSTAVVGQSGVGKSTLLNGVERGLGLKTKEIMKHRDRGRHTTTAVHLFKLQEGGYVVDTPGVDKLRLWGVKPAELAAYYPELEPLRGQCQFGDCSHVREPGCAVRAAVAAGRVASVRYEGYRRIFASLSRDE